MSSTRREPPDPAPAAPRFPEGFLWGVAGATHDPAGVFRTDDVAILRDVLGATAYRVPITWEHVLPGGRGIPDARAIARYDRLLDALLGAGVQPCLALLPRDRPLPRALEALGGWLHPDSPKWFAEYARVLFKSFADRATTWSTIDSPWALADGGYARGTLAPGHHDWRGVPHVLHNLLRAHGLAVQAFRASTHRRGIGAVVNVVPVYAATERPEDLRARDRFDCYVNEQPLDAMLLGRYPRRMERLFGAAWPHHSAPELHAIAQPLDWLGVHYQTRVVVRDDPRPGALPPYALEVHDPRAPRTGAGAEIYPDGLLEALAWVRDRYGPIPLHVTVDGAALADAAAAVDGCVADETRTAHVLDHLRAALRAVRDRVDLRGYFVDPLLDTPGAPLPTGLVHVHRSTLARTPKQSARAYAEVIRTRGSTLGMLPSGGDA